MKKSGREAFRGSGGLIFIAGPNEIGSFNENKGETGKKLVLMYLKPQKMKIILLQRCLKKIYKTYYNIFKGQRKSKSEKVIKCQD